MPLLKSLEHKILHIDSPEQFNRLALEIFYFQKDAIPVYGRFIESLPEKFRNPAHFTEIPFLPVGFFKSEKILPAGMEYRTVFHSSGTTGSERSKHYIAEPRHYEKIFTEGFKIFYGEPSSYCFLALLPSYLEQQNSSLVYMADKLIAKSPYSESGFYKEDHENLFAVLQSLKQRKIKTLLLGVTYALLDFAEKYRIGFPGLTVMETGGMKGRRREMIREEVHELLRPAFGVKHIHSEYGMTELMSQAYAQKNGIFHCPAWMKVLIRDANDPFSMVPAGQTGGINIIDLGNIYSCAFIATQDLGRLHPDGSFEVLGRFDHSDIRGCNLLA